VHVCADCELLLLFFFIVVTFSALTLLVGFQERHLVCNVLETSGHSCLTQMYLKMTIESFSSLLLALALLVM